MFRRIMIGLLGISVPVIASAILVSEVKADCPPPTGYKRIGGTCYFVNGVRIEGNINGTSGGGGLVKNPKKFEAAITPIGGTGALYCKNKQGKQPPGQRYAATSDELGCSKNVDEADVTSSQNGGEAAVGCTANLTAGKLEELGQRYCPTGQTAVDFFPCEFYSDVMYTSSKDGLIETAKHHCSLDLNTCLSIPWDPETDMPTRTPYTCEGPIELP